MVATEAMLTVPEIAEHLRLSRPRTYALIEKAGIPHIRLSERRIRVPRREFDVWLSERTFRAERIEDDPLNAV